MENESKLQKGLKNRHMSMIAKYGCRYLLYLSLCPVYVRREQHPFL